MILTAFILGLAGSLHCAGMCGPLLLMTPVIGNKRRQIIASRLLYHCGRITTYCFIGFIFGLVGQSIVLAGLQRWLSLIAGILLVAVAAASGPLKSQFTQVPLLIKRLFGNLLHQRTFASIFGLGAVNGLLPCGLVYMAATASISTGSALHSAAYMIMFGVGTLPMLLMISSAGTRFPIQRMPLLRKLMPLAIASVAIILIVRADPVSLIKNPAKAGSCPACRRK